MTTPDDWHLHLRDGDGLRSVVPHTAARFERAIVMPNLTPPVTTVDAALAYRQRILQCVTATRRFSPLMTLYLTDETPASEIEKAADEPAVIGVKMYPAGTTTNSASGVTGLRRIESLLEVMEAHDLPLLIHGEVADPEVDIFDREKHFVDRYLADFHQAFPKLRIVLEHMTTRHAVDFVTSASSRVAGTITPQHLIYNRNDLLSGGIKPHLYCLPILKREPDRLALLEAAISGNPKFFLGTDSAPHPKNAKESACGCAGCYSACAAIELYAEVFDQAGALDRLEAFSSFHGADFYRLPRNNSRILLEKQSWTIPESYPFGGSTVIPLMAGSALKWKLTGKVNDQRVLSR